ncbi:SIS domain-containing protein [Pseudodesulfovibrio sp. JC047]|nr:SIS domain-containing protein [Pseudodesulfovibrio sp. JC047]
MFRETHEAPAVVALQKARNDDVCAELAARYQKTRPRFVTTCARGSSDHAATYAKYLMEVHLGIPVLSMAPSVGSIYCHPMNLKGCLFIVISQSGKSPDLLACAQWARKNGAFILAVVNEEDSPAAQMADAVLPLLAGLEQSVAATKSYIASLSALLHFTAAMSGDMALGTAFNRLPEHLDAALALSWEEAVEPLADAETLFVVGRGLSYGVALEAALKLKETSSLHGEGISGAEIMHGPLALVRRRSRVLAFSQEDATRPGLLELAEVLRGKGAKLFMAEEGTPESGRLPVVPGMHPAAAPIAMIQSFYTMANQLALARGMNPDNPPSLKKVTETL